MNNPTYYGICSDLKKGSGNSAQSRGMLVLVDEAHGTHFYFGDNLPVSAMEAGADMASVSMHKNGGSLTQSSFLLINNYVSEGYTRQIINLTQTTSGSYLLMSSLDLSRKNLAFERKGNIPKGFGTCRLCQGRGKQNRWILCVWQGSGGWRRNI